MSKTVDGYDKEDGWYKDAGIEQCPHCETPHSPNGGYVGVVFDKHGTRFDTLYESDPKQGPYFCADCFEELETNRRKQQNIGLGEFA